jgi:hypothetical protein
MLRIRQQFERPCIHDIAATVRTALERLNLERTIRPGQTVALTAGSRGIANIPQVLRSVAGFFKDLGAQPILIPAMGSHGGGTVEGQRKVLESYGITEDFVGAPIRASMEVVSLGKTQEGFPVVLDRLASEADHIGIVARIKPHTRFHGPIESGLLKMMMIGLGKHAGALAYHRILLESPYDQVVRSVCRSIQAKAPITFGLGLVENAYDETALIEAVRPADFEQREEHMLAQAKRWMPRLPFREVDLLIVDEIGKDISGAGMDTNVIGRKGLRTPAAASDDEPVIRHIFVRGLTARAHGNATGIGNANFTTTRLIQSMNYRATVINCLTAGHPEGAYLPVHFETDREVLDAALSIQGTREPQEARIVHIRNTLHLEDVEISEPCLREPQATAFSVLDQPYRLTFDAKGDLLPL